MRIIWLCLDGVRADKLNSCGYFGERLFIDDILIKGKLFPNMTTCCTFSSGSSHSSFTSLYPWQNGVNGYGINFLRSFKKGTQTLTSELKKSGYKTFRWCGLSEIIDGVDIHQAVPKDDFDVWAHGHDKWSVNCSRRSDIIDLFNKDKAKNKFLYMHLVDSHEYPVKFDKDKSYIWDEVNYVKALKCSSLAFKNFVWDKLNITENDFVIISTDHGVRLNKHLIDDIKNNGVSAREENCRIFCSFLHKDIKSSIDRRLVSNLDIAATILNFIDPLRKDFNEGHSLLDNTFNRYYVITSSADIYLADKMSCWGIKDSIWKYWHNANFGEWLVKWQEDEDINLIDDCPNIANNLKALLSIELNKA